VVGISDGGTLTLLAPQSRQPDGTRAQQELSALVFRKAVRVVVDNTDRYGRTVGRVWAGAVDVNAELVRRGVAWVYGQYNRDPALPPLEAEARRARRGLWALPASEQVPPWDWRHSGGSAPTPASQPQRQPPISRPAAPPQASAGAGPSCGAKRYCTQMTSCAEAQFFFR
jgi:hypothetical protein